MELILIFAAYFIATLIALLIRRRGVIEWVSVIASLIALAVSFVVAIKVAALGTLTVFSVFTVDSLSAIVMLIIATVGFAVSAYSVQYLRCETTKEIIGFHRVRQYFILLNLFFAAMFLAITASSPIFTWISIEATTLSTAFLISFYNKPTSMEAAWKYLIINSVGLLLGFFGTLLYFTPIGSGAVNWQILMSNAAHLDPLIAKIAFVFVLIGYGTKVGLAPMHTWLPDAHSKAPAPISALLSGVLLNVALIVVLRFKVITDEAIGLGFTQNLLIIFGLFSIIIASLIIVTQKSYKRLLAYSSIENMGLMALGFGFGGLGIFASIFHMIYHALIKSALFMSAGTIFLKYSSTKIRNVRGVLKALPMTSILFLAGFFVITGMPPFGIFLTKIFILSAGIKLHPAVTVVAMAAIAILFIGFFKHVTAMVFGEKPAEMPAGEESIWLVIPPLALILIAFGLSFLVPAFLSTLISNAVAQY